jgi:hypothetical protein
MDWVFKYNGLVFFLKWLILRIRELWWSHGDRFLVVSWPSTGSLRRCLRPVISSSAVRLARKLKLGLWIGAEVQRTWTRGVASYIEITEHPFCVNHAECLCVMFGKRVKLKIHVEMIEANAFRTCATSCSLFRSERLSNDIDTVQGCCDLRLPCPGICGRQATSEIAAPAKQCSPHDGELSKAHIEPRFAYDFQTSEHVSARYTVVQAASRSVTKSWEWKLSPNWSTETPQHGR